MGANGVSLRRTLNRLADLLFLVLVCLGLVYLTLGLIDLLASYGCP
jgi:hypothetical protein